MNRILCFKLWSQNTVTYTADNKYMHTHIHTWAHAVCVATQFLRQADKNHYAKRRAPWEFNHSHRLFLFFFSPTRLFPSLNLFSIIPKGLYHTRFAALSFSSPHYSQMGSVTHVCAGTRTRGTRGKWKGETSKPPQMPRHVQRDAADTRVPSAQTCTQAAKSLDLSKRSGWPTCESLLYILKKKRKIKKTLKPQLWDYWLRLESEGTERVLSKNKGRERRFLLKWIEDPGHKFSRI